MNAAEPISLFAALAVQGAFEGTILPSFSKATGVPIDRAYDPTTVLSRRIQEGARPDILVAVSAAVEDFAAKGVTDESSRTVIALAGLGVAVPEDANPPDIGDLASFVSSLRHARSVAYSRKGASGIYFAKLLGQLGIADEINAHATIIEKGFTAETLCDGRADLAIQQLSELMVVPGVRVVGEIPSAVQHYTEFSAAVGTHVIGRSDVAELLRWLTNINAREVYVKAGLKPTF